MGFAEEKRFERYLCYVATHDEEFLSRYAKFVRPESYTVPEERWLISQALQFWENHKAVIPFEAFAVLLQEKKEDPRFDKEICADLWDGPNGEGLPPAMREFVLSYADQYLRKRLAELMLGGAADMLDNDGSFEDLMAQLNRSIDELNQDVRTLRREPSTPTLGNP